jgi:arsenite-transporting ATPase
MLTIAAGKGGVGKTTVSSALALAAADAAAPARRTLLVSTDPAPSVGDAFGISNPQWATASAQAVDGVSGLFAWQMDATTAFNELRDRYQTRIDELFGSLVGKGINVAHDRAILRDLLALAPPGIDELYSLASLGETLEAGEYHTIIVDPAPTGHLMRLLEMPALALDWSHRLMRLILKYKELIGLGEVAEELLAFSRRTRHFEQLLQDPSRAGAVLVTLEEPLVRSETVRLASALAATQLTVVGVVHNRVASSRVSGDFPSDLPGSQLFAPTSETPLVGADAIREWSRRWKVDAVDRHG